MCTIWNSIKNSPAKEIDETRNADMTIVDTTCGDVKGVETLALLRIAPRSTP